MLLRYRSLIHPSVLADQLLAMQRGQWPAAVLYAQATAVTGYAALAIGAVVRLLLLIAYSGISMAWSTGTANVTPLWRSATYLLVLSVAPVPTVSTNSCQSSVAEMAMRRGAAVPG